MNETPPPSGGHRSPLVGLLHHELLPISDKLQEAGAVGVAALRRLPYGGMQWKFKAFQRDAFVVALANTLPGEFGTFRLREDLLAQRRLVFHSDALDLDLSVRRRGSPGAFSSARTPRTPGPRQMSLYPHLVSAATTGTRKAALIWDVPALDKRHNMIGPMLVMAKVARDGSALDDNDWEGGFALVTRSGDDLLPPGPSYDPDKQDWDDDTGRWGVDGDEYPQAE
ncbi:MAG: hypothetical protein INR66_27245 [Gordonia polyisoprenivorans]|nr:hypothetical protein [Gordonia polyisoprenivorans]